MEYTLTKTEKRYHRNFLWQCWRFACLSMKFRKLVRQAGATNGQGSPGVALER
ncbi:MAG: hypothetical protein P8Y27_03005 [Chromatiaceae bacterium]|jgi:hypothetical protein